MERCGRLSGVNSFYPRVIAVLREHGFLLLKAGKGSHEWWGNGSIKVQVPFNCYSRHTANAVMSQAGIDHHF